jgi:Asp-tRNA(Asn)/Glu-tRNA(Gln) amidotransferase A subunit family amidase
MTALLGGTTAAELRDQCCAGELSVSEVAAAVVAAIGEDPLHAWACVDADALARQAVALDRIAAEDRRALPLFGVPIGIKDNFDTFDLPTAYGSPIYAGHQPTVDAAAVAALRSAGALIAGKTKLAEFAWLTAPDTLNPVDSARTPGGSSSGSAAAVAAGAVPLATGTQTAGSINRPASYCGVLGWKPTFERYSRAGVKPMSATLDTVGLLARSVTDLRLVDAALVGDLVASGGAAPRLAFARTDCWDALEEEAVSAISAWLPALEEISLPGYARLVEAQDLIQRAESARALAPELRDHAAELSEPLRALLHDGAALSVEDVRRAVAVVAELRPGLVEVLRRYDGVLTPSTTGVPPLGRQSTGDSLFCRVWTLIGAPSLSLPLVWSPDGLPVGLQVVGAPGSDLAVFDAAEWLLQLSP